MFKKKVSYLGFLGFMGFMCFRFFSSGNISDLGYIGFFGFFANFFIAKISGNRMDERYYEDIQKAKAFIGDFAIIELAIIMVVSIIFPSTNQYLLVLNSACFALTLIVYAVKLYVLEEK